MKASKVSQHKLRSASCCMLYSLHMFFEAISTINIRAEAETFTTQNAIITHASPLVLF